MYFNKASPFAPILMDTSTHFTFRKASITDVDNLAVLIDKSARVLNKQFYPTNEIEAALGTAWVVDEQLIRDQTYWVAENKMGNLIGCGGWSKRKILFGNKSLDATSGDDFLIPEKEPAKIRAFFVDPDYARKGIGKSLLKISIDEALKEGYISMELVATLSGVKLYKSAGFEIVKEQQIETRKGVFSTTYLMRKQFK